MSRVFIIEDDRIADAIELLLEKKKEIDSRKNRKIHAFSDYVPSNYRSGCYSGGCGSRTINTYRSGCYSSGCGSRTINIYSSGCGCHSGC